MARATRTTTTALVALAALLAADAAAAFSVLRLLPATVPPSRSGARISSDSEARWRTRSSTPPSIIRAAAASSSSLNAAAAAAAEDDETLLDEIKSMRVRQLKSELDALGIDTRDAFEKEELVKRLYEARTKAGGGVGGGGGDGANSGAAAAGGAGVSVDAGVASASASASTATAPPKRKKKKKVRTYSDEGGGAAPSSSSSSSSPAPPRAAKTSTTTTTAAATTSGAPPPASSNAAANNYGPSSEHGGVLRAPLTFLSLDGGRSVAASNAPDVYVRPSAGQFASVTFDVPSSSKPAGRKSLNLLVDTACSGVVLRPSAVRDHSLPTFSGPGSMTGAGGTSESASFATLRNPRLCGRTFRASMPCAVQDIGALPRALDGIVGLSFLNQFSTVEFDFARGGLNLYDDDRNPPLPSRDGDGGGKGRALFAGGGGATAAKVRKVAEADMRLTSLGIYVADVVLDGRPPARMLVDTGAASTLLNWRGVSDMGLSRDSPRVTRNVDSIGAIGADNAALRLTHRYALEGSFGFDGARGTGYDEGVQMNGGGTVNIDIGDIPVLDALGREGVGGILGADLLMRCDLVRINLKGSGTPRIALYK